LAQPQRKLTLSRIADLGASRSERPLPALRDQLRLRPKPVVRVRAERCGAGSPERPFVHLAAFFGTKAGRGNFSSSNMAAVFAGATGILGVLDRSKLMLNSTVFVRYETSSPPH